MFTKLVTILIPLVVVTVVAKQEQQHDHVVDTDLEPEWPEPNRDNLKPSSTSGITMRLLMQQQQQGPSTSRGDRDHFQQIERNRRSPGPIYTGYFPIRSHVSTKSGSLVKGRILHGSDTGDEQELEGLIPSDEEILSTSAQSLHGQKLPGARRTSTASRRPGYSGTVAEGKSRYVSRYNEGVPVYGAGEPYYFSYTHNFPIGVEDFENLVNSHNLPKKYKFTGSLDVTGLLE